jgi:hypothetical protein
MLIAMAVGACSSSSQTSGGSSSGASDRTVPSVPARPIASSTASETPEPPTVVAPATTPEGKFLEAWGKHGTEPGQFDFAYPAAHDAIGGIAFAPDGTFYTFDAGNLRVQHFSADRKLMSSWGSFGTGDGQFAKPTSIAVDGRGHVFVADASRVDVQEFEPDGTFVKSFGANAIDSRGFVYITADHDGDVFAGDGTNIVKFAPDGSVVARYDISAVADIVSGMAVARSGALFVQARPDNAPQATIELDRDGRLVHVWPATGEAIALDPNGKAAYITDVEWPFVRKYELPAS